MRIEDTLQLAAGFFNTLSATPEDCEGRAFRKTNQRQLCNTTVERAANR
jgi:hypothetical protein